MHKKIASVFNVVALMAIGLSSTYAQTSTKTNSSQSNQNSVKPAVKKATNPAASPSWILIEEVWWSPFRMDFSNSLHQARVHYRSGQEKAAASEIEKAVSWLKYAENDADEETAADLATAKADLTDFAEQLKDGNAPKAKQLESAFAHASTALAKHHHFKADKALAKNDLKTAGKHLLSAADHLRDAARSANYEYGSGIVEIFDTYSPLGYWDETVILDSRLLGKNLGTVESELKKLALKLGAKL